jgi:hypothetical protein
LPNLSILSTRQKSLINFRFRLLSLSLSLLLIHSDSLSRIFSDLFVVVKRVCQVTRLKCKEGRKAVKLTEVDGGFFQSKNTEFKRLVQIKLPKPKVVYKRRHHRRRHHHQHLHRLFFLFLLLCLHSNLDALSSFI